ncbi:hypothetical protein BPAE_0230g00120 [Botrytis paeoniae]|uniref:Uncharacterized protein n=1 Tax=Botrytis paeoniae TaxID=278948 RepID=A0A4Z1FEQ9_9HELO|nr:hypothetical protein BPAE_0230g00120 [Botrytis paeoniae]
MGASHDPEGRKLYDGENVTCFGHKFMGLYLGDDNLLEGSTQGFSPRGNDIKALKQRLVNSNTVQPDTMVKQGIQKMMTAYHKKDRENEEPVHQAQQTRHVTKGDQEEDEEP